jgi:hypothetical protein
MIIAPAHTRDQVSMLKTEGFDTPVLQHAKALLDELR